MKDLIIKLMFSVTGFTSLVAQSIPSYLPSDALVGWWPFNGNANDESGFQNHGVVTGAITTADRFGNPHKAYGFDGAIGQNIIVPNSASLNIVGTEISISYWVYSENPAYDSLFKGVSKGGWVSGAGYELIFRNNYNGDKGVYQFSIPNNLNTNLVLMPNVNSNIGKWVHLAGTFKNGLAKAYLDGVLVTTTTLNNITTLKPTLADLYFGTRHPSNGVVGQLKGKLDDIAIWKRELTAAEVKTIYEGCVVDIDANATSTAIKKNSEVDIKLNFENTTATFQWQADLGMGFQNLRDTNQFMGTLTPTLSLKNVQLKNHLQTFRALVKYGVCTVYSKPFTVVLHDTCIIEKSISVTDTLVIDMLVTGENDTRIIHTIKVFPNPTKDILNLQVEDISYLEGYTIRIVNAAGSTVHQSPIVSTSSSIHLSSLGTGGIYSLLIIDAQNQIKANKKIIMQ